MNNEKWKEVKGYEGKYEVSSLGKVKRLKTIVSFGSRKREIEERVLVPATNNGYERVNLSNGKTKNFFVHRLVAIAFVSGKSNIRKYVNHKDAVKTNNKADNLEWVTKKENTIHAYKLGIIKAPRPWNSWVLYDGKKVRMKKSDLRRKFADAA